MAYEEQLGHGRSWGRLVALGTALAWIAAACATGGGAATGDDEGPTSSGPGPTGTGGMGTGGAGTGTGIGTGGMGTGGMGTGGMCSEDPCKLIAPQCGCPNGEKCTWNAGTKSCAPNGDLGEGEACGSCQAGMLCVGLAGANTCKKFCATDAECTAGPGSACVLEINDPNNVPYPEKWCSDNCDPVSATGCPAGNNCLFATLTEGPMTTFTVCAGAGNQTQGATCTDYTDCAVGYGCFETDPNLMTNQCLKYCSQSNQTCPGSAVCQLIASVGSVQYGACL